MKKLIREPFIHFVLLGAAIFVAYHFLSARVDNQPGKILITQGDVTSMMIGFSRTWQRPPTREELDGLIRDRVRSEVYYREAVAMGLDRDDPIIRRRLQQKLAFVTDDVAAVAEPTNAELADYLKTHAASFGVDRRVTFSQVYLDPNKQGEHLARNANELLTQLRQKGRDADLSSLGDPFLLEHRFLATPDMEIAKQFGFAGALREVGLPQNAIPLALLFFNIGVELGQLLFIGAVMAVIAVAVRAATKFSRWSAAPQSAFAWCENISAYAIGAVAAFWLLERTLSFVA
jgi:hypothetical protein